MTQIILFYIFALLIVFTALRVITSPNPVHAALWLVLTFWLSACEWILMQAEFVAIVLALVYIGAVMVLFLFVVMMLNIDVEELKRGFWKNFPLALTIGAVMAVSLVMVLVSKETNLAALGYLPKADPNVNPVRAIGEHLYTDYLLAFEIAAVLLVLGMVSAISLVHRHKDNPKYIQPKDQVKVDRFERTYVVNMPSETEKPEPEAAEGEAGEGGADKAADGTNQAKGDK